MRYMFTIQGEGRGHLTQALVMQDMLLRNGDEIVAFLIGASSSRELPAYFVEKVTAPIITYSTPEFLPSSKNKRPNLIKSIWVNSFHLTKFWENINFIDEQIAAYKPDVIINFYELLTGLTYGFKRPSVPMVSIAHQYMFLHKDYKILPRNGWWKTYSLRIFTRFTTLRATRKLALSLYEFPNDEKRGITVVPPLLRPEVKQHTPTEGNYIHGYVLNSGFVDEIEAWHKKNSAVELGFFWDKKGVSPITHLNEKFSLFKLDDKLFLERMAGCKAYATTAGFESVCEAFYYQKPVLMVPAHIEQDCNAYDAHRAGVGIASRKFNLTKLINYIPSYTPNNDFRVWVDSAEQRILSELAKVTS